MTGDRDSKMDNNPWPASGWGRRTYLMGILNITPDSFSDGGAYESPEEAGARAAEMARQGADVIDVGAESTRPGAIPLSAEEEWDRLAPVFDTLRESRLPVPISVDTYKAATARRALAAGARIVNDVWGLRYDPEMAAVVAEHRAGLVLMHNRESPAEGEVLSDILRFFEGSLDLARAAGVAEDRIVLDPGIGFGKTYQQNLEVLRYLSELRCFRLPVLLGASRKSVIGKTLDLPVEDRLEGTLALSAIAVAQGINVIRVHDVEANRRAISMADALYRKGNV